MHHSSIKLLILLPLRAIYFALFNMRYPVLSLPLPVYLTGGQIVKQSIISALHYIWLQLENLVQKVFKTIHN